MSESRCWVQEKGGDRCVLKADHPGPHMGGYHAFENILSAEEQARVIGGHCDELERVLRANIAALTADNARLCGLLEYNACRCDDIAEDAGHLLVWVPSEARALIGGIQSVAQQIAVSLRAACTEGK